MSDNSTKKTTEQQPKLNILVLPSFTALLFFLILFVVLGAILTSILPASQLWWPPLVLGATILTLRDFLRWPAREEKKHHLQPLDNHETAPLQEALANLSQQANTPMPQLLISTNPTLTYAFGTFRRRFIGMGQHVVNGLNKFIGNTNPKFNKGVRAILAHELAHFINWDIQLAGLSRSLLKVTALVTVINLWASLSLLLLAIDMVPEFTQPQFWTELGQLLLPGLDLSPIREFLRNENPELFDRLANGEVNLANMRISLGLYLTMAHLPFILSTSILYVFFWPKLMRVREFYADARAAAFTGTVEAVLQAQDLYNSLIALAPLPPHLLARFKRKITAFTPSLLTTHPKPETRKQVLSEPIVAFGQPWQIAVWTGVAVFLFELILQSSLTLLYIQYPGPHLPLLTASLVFAIWLLPYVCQGYSLQALTKFIMTITPIFMIIKLTISFANGLFLGLVTLLGNLGAVGRIMDIALSVFVGGDTPLQIVGQAVSWEHVIWMASLGPIIYFIFFGLPVLIVTLLIDSWLKQQVLTWYALGKHIRWIFWLITIVMLSLLTLIVIPLGNGLFFLSIYSNWFLYAAISIPLGILIAISSSLAFFFFHKRLAKRCPQCEAHIPGSFKLGHKCSQCDMELHSWLIAPY